MRISDWSSECALPILSADRFGGDAPSVPPQSGDLFERFGWRGADATERPLRAAVVRALKGGSPSPRREKMKKLFTIFAMSGSLLILSACNTVEGAGEDVESAADCADGVEGNC